MQQCIKARGWDGAHVWAKTSEGDIENDPQISGLCEETDEDTLTYLGFGY